MCTSRCKRTARHSSRETSMAVCPTSRCTTSAASSSMRARSTRSPTPARIATSVWCPDSKRRRIEVRFPDATGNPYFMFASMLLAGLDGIQNKIHPGDPADKDLYDLEPEEDKKIPTVCHSLD